MTCDSPVARLRARIRGGQAVGGGQCFTCRSVLAAPPLFSFHLPSTVHVPVALPSVHGPVELYVRTIMKLSCTSCGSEISADQINIQKMKAVCIKCNSLINIDGELNIEVKPPASKIEHTESKDGFVLLFPQKNVRGLGWFFIVFGGFWDLISGSMILVTLFSSQKSIDILFYFMVPVFFVLGALILIGGISLLCLRTAVIADKSSIRIVRKTLGKEFVKVLAKDSISGVSKVERYKSNDRPVYGISFDCGGVSSGKVGVEMSDEEIGWIRNLVNKWKLS